MKKTDLVCDIDVRSLKRITELIFDHILNDLKIERMEIHSVKDFYWEVASEKLHCVKEGAPELDVGRLSDDWAFLRPILQDKQQAVALMLTHLAPLLRHLGEEVGQ